MKTGSLRARVIITTLALLAIVLAGVVTAVTLAYRAKLDGDLHSRLTTAGAAVERAGSPLELTPTELRLLAYLVRQRGLVLSKHQLLTQVWGYDAYDPNVVEVHVSALRRKLETHGPRILETVRGLGYRLDPR